MDWKAFDKLSYGLYLISTKSGEKAAGCVVNTFGQVTVSPVQVTVAINKDNFTTKLIQQSGVFTAAALSQEATMDLIGTFGFHCSEDTDKFAAFQTRTDLNGVPFVSEQTTARFSCKVVGSMDLGTHILFLAEVQDVEVLSAEESMTYAYYHLVKKGLTPPKASSYRPEKTVKGYRCKVCGYVHEGETLPDDFVCPVCGKGRDQFEKITD